MSAFTPDQVAIVTGAASGIGFAIANQLILDGITKIAVLDVSPIEASAFSTGTSGPVEILTLVADCSSELEVERAMETIVKEFERADLCVNAAGLSGPRGQITDLEKSDTEKLLGVNLMGVWICERAQIRQMLKQEMRDVSTGLPLKTRGSIVNIGSLASHLAIPGLSPYIMAKHGVLGLTKTDAIDYATQGIRVNCICPGWIKTGMTSEFSEIPAVSEMLTGRSPMKRWGQPEEVAYLASFLLSDRASFMTGASINVDGGYGAC